MLPPFTRAMIIGSAIGSVLWLIFWIIFTAIRQTGVPW